MIEQIRATGLALSAVLMIAALPASAQELDFAVQAGGTGIDTGYAIAVDASGASIVTGSFRGAAVFGAGDPNQTTLTAAGQSDIFVARYNPDGTLEFAVQAGGTGETIGFGIAVDGSGASTVAGFFRGTVVFGAGDPNQTSLTAADYDIFVARYNPDGTLEFAVQAGGTGIDTGYAIAVDGSGASTVTGEFEGTAVFGTGDPNQTTLTAAGPSDIFVARYNPDGTLDFAVQAGGTGDDSGRGIAVDGSGASTVTGFFLGTAVFGAGDPNQTTLTAAGSADIFVAKYAGGSPEAQILALIAEVDALVADGVLKTSRGRRLTKTLDRALLNVRRDKPVRACIDLAVFVVQVKLQIKLRWLPKDDGQSLIQGALAVIDELGCRRR